MARGNFIAINLRGEGMKKRIIILLLILTFCLVLVSCKTSSQDSSKESKSVYDLAVEAGFEGTLEEWSEAVANTKQNEPKSVYDLAVEAGFEGTLEDWCEAVANVDESHNNISLSDAILIAQTHYFAVFYEPPKDFSAVDIAYFYKEDEQNWYIGMWDQDVFEDGKIVTVKGGGHKYTISKETGSITEIDLSGE